MTQKAIFLDRDGVINNVTMRDGRPYTPPIQELFILPKTKEALQLLQTLGYRTFIFTNQPDIAKGSLALSEVEQIHHMMKRDLPLDEILFCPHVDSDQCQCRKPLPGMILQLAKDWDILLPKSYAVGDRWRDIEAGKAAGCQTVLLGDGYGERPVHPDYTFVDLWSFALWLKKENAK